VGTTGIEPVTPAMSMQCSPKIASQSAEKSSLEINLLLEITLTY
jgi:hypothetical protein